MKNRLMCGLALMVVSTNALALSVMESGECGTGCAYTIDDEGNLKITGNGSGTINGYKFTGKRNFTNVDIKGISNIGTYAFYDAGSGGGKVTIDDSLRSVGEINFTNFSAFDIDSTNFSTSYYSFSGNNVTLTISPLTSNLTRSTFTSSVGTPVIDNLTIKCKGDVSACAKSMDSSLRALINNNKNVSMTDKSGNSVVWNKDGYSVLDANQKVKAKYNKSGQLLLSYFHSSDGSTSIYDVSGKLVGVQGKRILTVDEATSLVKGNKNTFKIRYR